MRGRVPVLLDRSCSVVSPLGYEQPRRTRVRRRLLPGLCAAAILSRTFWGAKRPEPEKARGGGEGVAEILAAGVPPDDAEGIAVLTELTGARGPEPLSDPLTLLRFYLARSRDVEAAAAMYQATANWRAAFPIFGVMTDFGAGGDYAEDGCRATDLSAWDYDYKSQPRTPAAQLAARFVFFGRLRGVTAPDGAPVLVWRAGLADYAGFVREGLVEILIQAFVVHLEDALQSARAASLREKRLVHARLIIDAAGFSTSNLVYLTVLRRVLVLCQEYYPEVAASITIVRTPLAVEYLYSAIQLCMNAAMREKFAILGEDFERGLLEHSGLQVKSLPAFLGGNASDEESGISIERVPHGIGALLAR